MAKVRLYWFAFLILAGVRAERLYAGQPECTKNCFAWQERSVGPEARSGHAMVYDETREVLVLFGGSSGELLGDTWERRDGEWQLRDCTGPAPRSGHAMVYDSLRGVTVLFGGYAAGVALNDTWEWDGVVWTLVAEAGPSPRSGHAMAFKRDRGRTVLFGGDGDPQSLNDTWEWDGAVWTLRTTDGPASIRSGLYRSMTYDEARGVTVLHGAVTDSDGAADVWEWDGVAWVRKAVGEFTGPDSAHFGIMVYDPARGLSVLLKAIGCQNLGYCMSVWEWDGVIWRERDELLLPYAPDRAAAVYDRSNSAIQLFGGTTTGEQTATFVRSDDLWELSATGWTKLENGSPAQRWGHSMAYDLKREVAVLFGGNGTPIDAVGSLTWEWDGGIWTMRGTQGPGSRAGHAMAFDSARSVTVLFGGAYYTITDDTLTWEWDGLSWASKAVPGPGARMNHAMAFDSRRRVTVMFGGYNSDVYLGDTWEWDGIEWRLRSEIGPDPRVRHAMTFDSARGVTILFGGTRTQAFGDTWEWDGTTWSLRSTDGPVPRSRHAMAYDEGTGRTVLFGGELGVGYPSLGDTWAWDGTDWTLLATTGPAPRRGHAMVFDSDRSEFVLFGGRSGSPMLSDTWELRSGHPDDDDADGVLDECDQCPATPSGVGAIESGCIVADPDFDGDADLADFQAIQNCRQSGYVSDVCGVFDLNQDYYVDGTDLGRLISMLSGPN